LRSCGVDLRSGSWSENAKNSSRLAASASAAPVKNAAPGDTRVQIAPNSTLAARPPMPSAAL